MKLLLDTHTATALWAALDPDALTDGERRCIGDAEGPLVLSAVVVWELRLKWHSLHISGARKGPIGPAAMVAFATAMAWQFLPLTAQHASAELVSPIEHKDPFDELLLVQAQLEELRLLTRDRNLVGHPLTAAGTWAEQGGL